VLASGTPQLGPQASIATLLYPGIEDVGFIFWSRTRDAVQRPVLWIGGRSQAALQFAARFLLEGQLSPIRCPATYPDEPIEIVLVPCAHVDHVTGMIGFNNLDISITSADLRYDCDSGLWLSFERRSQIFLRYAGSIVTSVTINTTEITPSQSSKFDLISHLVRSTQEGRWLTMDEIREEIFGAKTKLSKNQAAGLRARLTDIRNIDRSLVKERKREGCSVLEYQLDADIHTIKL